MERLTIDEIIEHCDRKAEIYEKVCGVKYLETKGMDTGIKEYWEHKQVTGYLRKLKAYEDAEEQGLLLRLPCKEAYSKSGDYVYFIYEGEVIECVHCGLKIDSVTGKGYITLAAGNDYPYLDEEVSKIGETLFFTREQAEAKLAEMEGAK